MSSSLSPRAPGADLSQRRKVWSSAVGSMMGSLSGGDCWAKDGVIVAAKRASASKTCTGKTMKELFRRRFDITKILSVRRIEIAGGESLRRKWRFVNRGR